MFDFYTCYTPGLVTDAFCQPPSCLVLYLALPYYLKGMTMDTTFPGKPGKEETLERLRSLSKLLDTAINIPIINYRIGWDAIIGLVPGIGDAAGLLFSAYIVFEAARLEVPKNILARMMFNVALEFIIGTVPLFGDLFDAAFKANIRNVRLLEENLRKYP